MSNIERASDRVREIGGQLASLLDERGVIERRINMLLVALRHLVDPIPEANGVPVDRRQPTMEPPRLTVVSAEPPMPSLPILGPRTGGVLPEATTAGIGVATADGVVMPKIPSARLKDRILFVMAEAKRPLSKNDIAKVLDEPPVRIRYSLAEMRKKYGLVVCSPNDVWSITEYGQRHVERIRSYTYTG